MITVVQNSMDPWFCFLFLKKCQMLGKLSSTSQTHLKYLHVSSKMTNLRKIPYWLLSPLSLSNPIPVPHLIQELPCSPIINSMTLSVASSKCAKGTINTQTNTYTHLLHRFCNRTVVKKSAVKKDQCKLPTNSSLALHLNNSNARSWLGPNYTSLPHKAMSFEQNSYNLI